VKFYGERVIEGLTELVEGGRTSFVEAVMSVYEDSGLTDVLDAGVAYDAGIDAALVQLRTLCDQVLDDQGVSDDPPPAAVRTLAGEVLETIRDWPIATHVGEPLGPAEDPPR